MDVRRSWRRCLSVRRRPNELGTEDKVTINIDTIDGHMVTLDEASIILIAGPYPKDVGTRTHVYTNLDKLFVTAEAEDKLVDRLVNADRFVVFTRPDRSTVRVKGSAVVKLRDALSTEAPARSVLFVGKLHQAVMEDISTVRRLIKDHGGSV